MTARSRRWTIALACAMILGVPAAVSVALWQLTRDDTPADLADGAKPLGPETVAVIPGLYLLGKTSPGVAYAVDTSDGLVLIDSGLEAAAVTGQLRELGLDIARLKAVLITHVHADHSLGAAQLRATTAAKVYAGRDDCPPLRSGEPRVAFFSIFHMPNVSTHPTTVDVELVGDETLTFGDTTFRAIASPGHTPGSVCYLMERRGVRSLFAGDVVQCLTPTHENALGTYSAYLPPVYRGNARDYLSTLHRLRDLPTPHLVLPAHPEMDATPQSPQLSVEKWHGLLGRGITAMTELQARYDADGADFLDGAPKELLPGLHYLGDLDGVAVYVLAADRGLFLFDAPGGPALSGFLDGQFRRLGWSNRKVTAVVLTSAGPEATAGLAEVVKKTGCKVMAPTAGLDHVRSICPAGTEVLPAEELAKLSGLEVRVITVAGRGRAPVAYSFRWAYKNVLLAGRMPVKLDTQSTINLMREVAGDADRRAAYRKSLAELGRLSPNLWLPAVPVRGQNANVYDQEWPDVLGQNAEMFP